MDQVNNIAVTNRAASRIKAIVAGQNSGALRISVNGGGCSGFQYEFAVTESREPDDIVIEHEGATVLIDSVSLPYMQGSVVDFVDDLMGQSFKIQNPQAKSSCGCGTSFSI
jgi:iron-sulfur cluster assembly accessory protein